MDAITRDWMRCPADERAVRSGCLFRAERGAETVWWIERNIKLYEGEQAGQSLILRGCHECGNYGLPAATEFDLWEQGSESWHVGLERVSLYSQCVTRGHLLDWQYECTMRLFSWERWSEKWRRMVRRFRQASIWVAKKCKKSPTLAAWGHYLLSGDGEPGQKVFFAAKDGKQARAIAGEHAMQMLLQSPELMAECKPNKSTYRISHLASRSYMEPLSSSNARTQESKEGLNGSVLIDETHVVDGDFVRRISRAGISRSEPLQIEVSTAGNNPDGYGRQRFDLARKVEAAEPGYEDDELFVAIYAAPQELTDEDLDADPLKWGKMANPAMGHTVDPEEYLRDYRQSRQQGIQALLDFKMYRLNIWQRGSNPWLKEGDWAACRRDFGEADLAGQLCWAGLDLSRTHDLSALVLAFPAAGEEAFYLLPYFWMAEDRARELAHLAPFLEWARAGWLTLIPGAVIQFSWIKAHFRKLAAKFNIQDLAYDPKFAEDVTQVMEHGATDDEGNEVEEGTGVPRFVFAQNDANFAQPTEDFERLVLAGKLWHNGHPVLGWQAGHAEVMRKISKVKRVVKPAKDSWRTVDGVQAGIMALARAMLGQQTAVTLEVW